MKPFLLRNALSLHLRLGFGLSAFATAFLISHSYACANTAFPLRVAPGGAYLEDSRGRPFLIAGDSAWSLIGDLSSGEADLYLESRRRQGFNTILTSLIEHKFARNAPADFYGERPFLEDDFSRPNERYFARVESVMRSAASRNFLVLLCPAYLGAGGGDEGWYKAMLASGPEKLRSYGRYLGRRFGRFSNIVWVQGGDYDPPDKALVDAIAEGIAEVAPGVLQTVHTNRDTSSSGYWSGSSWLALDTVYTYENVATAVLDRYRSGPRRPFFMIEARYENEHGVDERDIRLAAYGALLSGASGQVFGNNPMWHFAAPGLFDTDMTWRQAIASGGAQSIDHLNRLFGSLDWWRLIPDEGKLLVSTEGRGQPYGLAARAQDGSMAVLYVNDAERLMIDASALRRGVKRLQWIDPSSGVVVEDIDNLAGDADDEVLVPSGLNAHGFRDWVAVLTTRP